MAGRKDFDNIFKVIEAASVFTAGTLVSLEIDLELPRGYIAKIFAIELRLDRFPGEDFEGLSADDVAQLDLVLIRDPDDTTTTTMNSNVVDHDVIADHSWSMLNVGAVAGDPGRTIYPQNNYRKEIPEHVDLITGRNLRFNIVGAGTDVALLTETIGTCQIEYTLEKVTDDLLLNILDIL